MESFLMIICFVIGFVLGLVLPIILNYQDHFHLKKDFESQKGNNLNEKKITNLTADILSEWQTGISVGGEDDE